MTPHAALDPSPDTAAPTVPALTPRRLRPSDWAAGLRAQALGGLCLGGPGDGDLLAGLPMPVLPGSDTAIDAWLGEGPWREGRTGAVRWRTDGHWLWGHADLPDAQADLAAQAQAVYADVFATLAASGLPHLLRVWNYLPRINAEGSGLERYRQFNAGRQQAFLDSGAPAFEGAPAACCLGTGTGGLVVRFIASRRAPRPLENPRQVPAWAYPSAYGPRAPTFSRAALADMGGGQVGLWISGTASIVGHATVHAGDVAAQTRETVANLRAVIGAAQPHTTATLSLQELVPVVYVRHAADAAVVRAELDRAWGPDSPAARQALLLQGDVCRADLLVEVEAHLLAPGVLR